MTRTFSRILATIVATAALTLTGCMDVDTLVTVNKDATGKITQTIVFGQAMMQMMSLNMSNTPGGDTGTQNVMLNSMVEQFKTKAPQLGEGVKCVSAEPLTEAGKTGLKVVYSFTDVRKLRVSQQPEMGPSPMSGMPGQGSADTHIVFDMVQGNPAKLVIKMPQPDYKPEDVPTNVPAVPEVPQVSEEQQKMMKDTFGDLCIKVRVQVNGEIKNTNASYVDTDPVTKRKNTVTLLNMNVGQVLGNPEYLKKLSSMGKQPDLEQAKKIMKDFPGLKIETAKSVEVSFE